MAFSASVSALLETYDNCLSLLKAFKRQKKPDGSRKVSRASEQQALLKRSLRADRGKVERAYSSRLSESGSSFEKGDFSLAPAKARSALGKVLRRLNAAIAGLLRAASKNRNPMMDYQSLMSLSHASRIQAVKTFDQLSHRLESKASRSSVGSSSSTASTAKTAKTAKSCSQSSQSTSKAPSNKQHRKKAPRITKKPHPRTQEDRNQPSVPLPKHSNLLSRRRDKPLPLLPEPPRIDTPLLDAMERRLEGTRDQDPLNFSGNSLRRRTSTLLGRRVSLMTTSTGSTRLGEIPERKWFRRHDDDDDDLEEGEYKYNAPIVYPLRPYEPVAREGRFLGLFRRRN